MSWWLKARPCYCDECKWEQADREREIEEEIEAERAEERRLDIEIDEAETEGEAIDTLNDWMHGRRYQTG